MENTLIFPELLLVQVPNKAFMIIFYLGYRGHGALISMASEPKTKDIA